MGLVRAQVNLINQISWVVGQFPEFLSPFALASSEGPLSLPSCLSGFRMAVHRPFLASHLLPVPAVPSVCAAGREKCLLWRWLPREVLEVHGWSSG